MESSSTCIFCTTVCPPSFTIIGGKPVKLKRENEIERFLSDGDDCSIQNHLKVIFVLRKILNIEEESCFKFLKEYKGQLHPEFWMELCPSCDELVNEFWEKLREIGKLERRLKAIKTKLTGFIQDTVAFKENGGGTDSVWKEIRSKAITGLEVGANNLTLKNDDGEEANDFKDNFPIPSPPEEVNDSQSDFEFSNEEEADSPDSSDTELNESHGSQKVDSNSPPPKSQRKRFYFKCSDCGDLSCNMIRYRLHQKLHKHGKGVKCLECGWLCQKLASHAAHWHPDSGGRNTMEERLAKREIREVKKTDEYNLEDIEEGYEVVRRVGHKRFFRCKLCPATNSHILRIRKHLEGHKTGTGIPCEVGGCGWIVEPEKMALHTTVMHRSKSKLKGNKQKKTPTKNTNTKYRYTCPDCTAFYRSVKELGEHQKLHENGSGVVCDDCGWFVGLGGYAMGAHRGSRHPKNGKRKVDVYDEANVVISEEIPYYCDHCHWILPSVSRLLLHLRCFHPDEPSLDCSACESKFKTKQLLNLHLKRDHGHIEPVPEEEEGLQQCQYCTEEFVSKSKKDLHVAKNHQDRLLTCVTCNLTFRSLSDFRKHMETTKAHANQKRYSCELCGKVTADSFGLKNHRQQMHATELGLEPSLQCTVPDCGKILSSQHSLDYHIRSVHTKEFKLTCEYCGKGFNSRHRMVEHVTKWHKEADKNVQQPLQN